MLYNASAYEKEEEPLIRNFLHFIYTNQPGQDDLSNRLSRLVEKCKENEKFRSDYLAVNLHDYDIRYEARQEGEAIGAQKQAEEAAINLLRMDKLSPEEIAQAQGLPLKRVQELKEKLNREPA